MSRQGDNIQKRKDGRRENRYSKGCSKDQSTKNGFVYGKTYQEAKKKQDWAVQYRSYEKLKTKNFLFKEILLAWQASNRVRLKESSVCRYQNLIDTHILPELGNIQVEHLSATIINRFLSQKLESGRLDGTGGLSAAYVRSIALVITSAIHFGVTEHLCMPLNASIAKPLLPKKELNILSVKNQEILEQMLLDAINEEKLLIFITLYTGLRIGEACALRWEDINLDTKLIFVRHGRSETNGAYGALFRYRRNLLCDVYFDFSNISCVNWPFVLKEKNAYRRDSVCTIHFSGDIC